MLCQKSTTSTWAAPSIATACTPRFTSSGTLPSGSESPSPHEHPRIVASYGEITMTEDQSKSGTYAGVVIVVLLFLLILPCAAGLVLFGAFVFLRLEAPRAMPLPPVPGANAPLPGPTMLLPNATITINDMQWSQNLFEAAGETLTLAKYDQIKPGMTYDELLATLAIPENRRPEDIQYVGPESKVQLKWFGGPNDAKSITVKMKGKVVIEKSQTGLE